MDGKILIGDIVVTKGDKPKLFYNLEPNSRCLVLRECNMHSKFYKLFSFSTGKIIFLWPEFLTKLSDVADK